LGSREIVDVAVHVNAAVVVDGDVNVIVDVVELRQGQGIPSAFRANPRVLSRETFHEL
jgi:hypothetical protein